MVGFAIGLVCGATAVLLRQWWKKDANRPMDDDPISLRSSGLL